MKRWYLCLFAFVAACVVSTPRPASRPTPPPPSATFRLQVYVLDDHDVPLVNARLYRDNVDVENPDHGGSPLTLGPDAGAAWDLTPQGFNICAMQDGYVATKDGAPRDCEPAPVFQDLTVKLHLTKLPEPPPPPPVPVDAWTVDQLRDLQGDLMLWAPEVGCASAETQIRCDARGLQAGWVWTLTTPRYGAANREKLYQNALSRGWTHYAIDVNACETGEGYHNLLPVTDCTGFDDRLNLVLRELHQHNLIPVCAGLAPGAPVAPGLDRSLCPVVMDDWDNDHKKDCRVKLLAETFPKALIFIEMPQGKNPDGQWAPGPDACSPTPFPSGGGAWIRNLQQKYPNFVGVLYEVTLVDGVDASASDLTNWNPWFRDLQQVVFETDTYWKFWDALPFDQEQRLNDQLRAKAPWTQGYFSGGTSHPAPKPSPTTDGHYDGELNGDQVQVVNAPDFRNWAATTSLDMVKFRTDCLEVKFAAQDTWPDTLAFPPDGMIQYSLGLCEKIGGTWYCSAPIELWRGLTCSGGPVQAQKIDGQSPGQIARNWFYASRWGAMNGYQPAPGEQIGVFVVQGDARNNKSSVQERSNIVLVKLPQPGEVATYVK